MDLENTHAQLTTLSGAWARERQMVTRPLVPGHQGVESVRGASSHQACPFMALGKSTVTEDEGEVYALSLCYSGSFWADVFVDCNDMARAQIGIQPFQFSWELKPGDSFQTPEAYLCYSANGLNGMSREFHHLCGRYITRGKYAHASRPLLVNNWEATYFDFNEDKLLELAAENLSMDPKALHIAARSENMCAVTADKVEKKLFGLMKKTSHPLRLIDEEGVIRLQKANATVRQADISSWRDAVAYMLEELTVYNDGGTNYPNVYIVLGKRIIDLSGMSSEEQIYSLANVELNGYDAKTPVIVAATLRIDS